MSQSPNSQPPNTPAQLLHAFRTQNATSPRLTWYGPDAERVEFSGRVLDNWVAKTANYLVDELDAEPGTVIALDVPLHWRSLVWLLAAWAVGATAHAVDRNTVEGPTVGISAAEPTATEGSGALAAADIVATTAPEAVHATLSGAKGGPLVVAVALPALQMRWMGGLPPRTLDYSGDVRSHADDFFPGAEAASTAVAWRHGTNATSYGQLLPAGEPQAPRRVLLEVREGWDAVVPAALHVWAAGGSVVLLDEGVTATDALRNSESVTRD